MRKEDDGFIFEKTKLIGNIDYKEFISFGRDLQKIIIPSVKGLESKIKTAQSGLEHAAVNSHFLNKENVDICRNLPEYLTEEFDSSLWDKSLNVSLYFKNTDNWSKSFLILLNYDLQTPRSLEFYGHGVPSDLKKEILTNFKKPSLKFPIVSELY